MIHEKQSKERESIIRLNDTLNNVITERNRRSHNLEESKFKPPNKKDNLPDDNIDEDKEIEKMDIPFKVIPKTRNDTKFVYLLTQPFNE